MYPLLIVLLVVGLLAFVLGGVGYRRRVGSQNTTITESEVSAERAAFGRTLGA